MADLKDPMGQAILDFAANGKAEDIVAASDICDDDIIPVSYLYRNFDAMPKLEQVALEQCHGRVLDVGAAAGMHADYLKSKGLNVDAIDISPNAVQHLKSKGINAIQTDFFDYNAVGYDTLLFLMNGIGIAKNLENLENTLMHAKHMLNEDGKILCDSSDIKYLYEDDEGGMWVDLNTTYYGNFRFQMSYKDHQTDWFEWLYVDFNNLQKAAENVGMKARIIYQEEDQYLAEITLK